MLFHVEMTVNLPDMDVGRVEKLETRKSWTGWRSAVVSNSQATSRISVRPARDRTPDPLIKSSLSDHTTSAYLYLSRIKSRLDRYGDPTGLLIAKPNAMILSATLPRGPKLSREDQLNSTRLFMRELNRFGITSVVDAGGGIQNYPVLLKRLRVSQVCCPVQRRLCDSQ